MPREAHEQGAVVAEVRGPEVLTPGLAGEAWTRLWMGVSRRAATTRGLERASHKKQAAVTSGASDQVQGHSVLHPTLAWKSPKIGRNPQLLPNFSRNRGQARNTFFRIRAYFRPRRRDIRPCCFNFGGLRLGQMRADFGRAWTKFGRDRQNLADSKPNVAEVGPNSAEIAQFGRIIGMFRAEIPCFAEFGVIRPKPDPNRTNRPQLGRLLEQIGRIRAKVGRLRTKFGRNRPKLTQRWRWPNSGQSCSKSATHWPQSWVLDGS